MKKIEEKEKQLKEETEEAKLSSFEDLVPPEPDAGIPSKCSIWYSDPFQKLNLDVDICMNASLEYECFVGVKFGGFRFLNSQFKSKKGKSFKVDTLLSMH